MSEFNYLPIKKVFYGIEANKNISKLVNKDISAYILTGKNTSSSKIFSQIIEILNRGRVNYEILPYISQHSPIEEVNEASERITAPEGKFQIIAYGGGAVIDASKILKGRKRPLSLLAIPTTLSASEFSHIAGYSDDHEKKGIRDIYITPDFVILDPENTISTPREIYLSSGVRSIDHAIESSLDLTAHDPRLYFSVNSYEILRDNLTDESLHGRLMSQIGAWMSYMDVYDAPMGLSHSIGKMIGARFNIPHGITSCLTLPYIISYYKKANRLGNFLRKLYGNEDYDRLRSEIERIIEQIGVKNGMSSYGITENFLHELYGKLGVNDPDLWNLLKEML